MLFLLRRSGLAVLSAALLCSPAAYTTAHATAQIAGSVDATNLHSDPGFIKNGTDWIFLNSNHSFQAVPGMGKALRHSGTGTFQDSHVANLKVTPGAEVQVAFLAMRPTATTWSGNGFGIHLQYRDANDRSIGYVEHYVTQAALPGGVPTLLQFSHTVPAGAASARLVHSIRDTFPRGAVGYTARPRGLVRSASPAVMNRR